MIPFAVYVFPFVGRGSSLVYTTETAVMPFCSLFHVLVLLFRKKLFFFPNCTLLISCFINSLFRSSLDGEDVPGFIIYSPYI